MKHRSIGKPLGILQLPTPGKEIALLMTPCVCSLEEWLKNTDHLAAYNTHAAKYYMMQFAFDICRGLATIHSSGYVYGDLCPGSVTVSLHVSSLQ